MKTIIIDGRIGKDGKVMTSQTGKPYISFSLANDSFVNGSNKTEWFDVTTWDPFTIEKRAKFFTKGRYIIVHGTLNSEVTAKNGKVYLNQYVTAKDIEFPSFGSKKDDAEDVQVSTFTGGTKSQQVSAQVAEEKSAVSSPVTEVPKAQHQVSSVAASAPAGWNDGDDLPF